MSDVRNTVHPQITDAVTQVSNHALGLGPAVATIQACLGQTQALSILYANMVAQQQEQALTSMANTVRSVRLLETRALTRQITSDPAQSPGAVAFSHPPVVT